MNGETLEFTEWWNTACDPDETGRTRMMASHAFEAGRAKQREIDSEHAGELSMLEAERAI